MSEMTVGGDISRREYDKLCKQCDCVVVCGEVYDDSLSYLLLALARNLLRSFLKAF